MEFIKVKENIELGIYKKDNSIIYSKTEISQLSNSKNTVKPFLKWAGGKNQLLNEIEKYYPFENGIKKYAEPFVGGGAVLFDILNKYDLEEIYINDINEELINTYIMIREHIDELIQKLFIMQDEFIHIENSDRKMYYGKKREKFNFLKLNNSIEDDIEKAAIMIFLNKTCFNGLYRVNKKGFFNVPMGDYKNPMICDEDNLRLASEKLNNIKIESGDYRKSEKFIDKNTFVYIDPPYRPLTRNSGFTAYSQTNFDDKQQIRLSEFINFISKNGAKVLLSNSDPKNIDEKDDFFDNIYSKYKIRRVEATRMINSKASARGKIKELLISNY
ncbi:MAG: DNA adenine methylase [Peptoanaerobacter stomatis]|uniref:DNA adenine methylase n=1 Tax=Peptoanaerobacter stomatis TaxID=796937 RepID=UPI003F9F6E90